MKVYFLFLICFCFCSLGLSQYHQPVFSNLSDEVLLSKLVEEYKTATVLSYGEARDVMFSEIYNENDYVSGIYSNHSLYLDPSAEPRSFLYMNGIANGINCEHSFPRSKGADSGNPKSDIHHLFPSRTYVNNARGSKPFAEIVDSQTDNWFFEDESSNSIPSSNIDNYSENDTDAFEPRESVKGNIARAMMYFYTMYKPQADNKDSQFFSNQVETLCQWHFDDPVDSLEFARTWLIANYQDGKANPFVLDCSVASRTYCQQLSDQCMTLPIKEIQKGDINIFPNPSQNELNISFTEDANVETVKILDGLHLVETLDVNPNTQLTYKHDLSPGYYLCQFTIEGDLYYKSFVVIK